jgi:hypothetical protein
MILFFCLKMGSLDLQYLATSCIHSTYSTVETGTLLDAVHLYDSFHQKCRKID